MVKRVIRTDPEIPRNKPHALTVDSNTTSVLSIQSIIVNPETKREAEMFACIGKKSCKPLINLRI